MRILRLFLVITCAALVCADASAQQVGQAPEQSHEQAAGQKLRAAEKDAKAGREEKDAGAPGRTSAGSKGLMKARAKHGAGVGKAANRPAHPHRVVPARNAQTSTAAGAGTHALPASLSKPHAASGRIVSGRNTKQEPTLNSALGGRQFVNARNRNANAAIGGASEASARSGGGISGTSVRRKP
jgi:hypothetical protein